MVDTIKERMAGYKQSRISKQPIISKEPKYEYPPVEMTSGGVICEGSKCVGVKPSELNQNLQKR